MLKIRADGRIGLVPIAFFIVGFLMMSVFGVTFNGGKSNAWLLAIGVMFMFVSPFSSIAALRSRIEELENVIATLARRLGQTERKD